LLEVAEACARRAGREKILSDGELPVILGGDHSIAMGSVAGVASHFRETSGPVGLLWFDAHADMNTPETSPSGNLHGMPLAVLLGYGAEELTGIEGFSPKIDPRFCAHIGARDVDPGERELIQRLGLRFFTMREIDERGMSACVDEAIEIVSKAPAGYHVTLDVDALDPGDAPGSGTVVRGGLTYREAHLAMEHVAEAGGMTSIEVVEINTALDVNNRTAELGVELLLSALGQDYSLRKLKAGRAARSGGRKFIIMGKKISVGVVFGGRSGEHEVSLRSARTVIEALDRKNTASCRSPSTRRGAGFRPPSLPRFCPARPERFCRKRWRKPEGLWRSSLTPRTAASFRPAGDETAAKDWACDVFFPRHTRHLR
jgi:arginase